MRKGIEQSLALSPTYISLLSTTIAQSVRNLKVTWSRAEERLSALPIRHDPPKVRFPSIAFPTMAAPENLSTLDVSAVYTLVRCPLLYFSGTSVLTLRGNLQNKELSDDTDGILSMQGIGWFIRSAISIGVITIYVKHYKDENGIEHVDMDRSLAGLPGTTEKRELDWTDREHYDNVFGALVGKSRRRNVADIEDQYLKSGWLPDTVEHGVIASSIQSDTEKSGYSWSSEEVRLSQPWFRARVNFVTIGMGL